MKKFKTFLSVLLIIWLCVSLNDLLGQNVFWIESDFDTPRLVKTGSDSSQLISVPLTAGSQPQDLVLDTNSDMLFWNGLAFVNAQINTAPTDLSSVAVVLDSQTVMRGIALDHQNNKIYWTSTNLIADTTSRIPGESVREPPYGE